MISLFNKINLKESVDFDVLKSSTPLDFKIYPVLIDKGICPKGPNGWVVSGIHGRSIIVNYDSDGYTLIKGAGLSYWDKLYVNISEYKYRHIWGYLNKSDATKEYLIGNEFYNKGGLGPKYKAVIRINQYDKKYDSGINKITPYLLQYKVKCPIRVSDYGLFSKAALRKYLAKEYRNDESPIYISFAKKCLENLIILHNNHFFYNSLNIYNTSLLGEFVDFESSFAKNIYAPPKDFPEYESLMAREIINLIQVVEIFSNLNGEVIDYATLKTLIKSIYFEKLENKVVKKHSSKILQFIS